MYRQNNYKGPYAIKSWILSGFIWGVLMFLFAELAYPYFKGESYTFKGLMTGLIAWLLGGLVYGYVMHVYYRKNSEEA